MSFIELQAIRIKQPLSEFYISRIPADKLEEIAFSEQLQYTDETGTLKGNQRIVDEKRLKEIARYIDSVEMTFPNSIILAANYSQEESRLLGTEEKDLDLMWKIIPNEDETFKIVVPTNNKLAAVIDGQHRLQAFKFVQNNDRKSMDLICTIYFDLPISYQAFLFATINGNQKMVDKSLAFEQFGFNVKKEPPESWTPEKFAVSLTRKMNTSSTSPFYMKIKLAPIDDGSLFSDGQNAEWYISTATVVNGLLGLFSAQPKRDRVEMGQKNIFRGRTRKMLSEFYDSSPLRKLFLENQDDQIQKIVEDYFKVVDDLLWKKASHESYITKTVGVQALFEFLKKILQQTSNIRQIEFQNCFSAVLNVDFSDNYFQASGVGKSRIKRVLYVGYGAMEMDELKDADRENIARLMNIK